MLSSYSLFLLLRWSNRNPNALCTSLFVLVLEKGRLVHVVSIDIQDEILKTVRTWEEKAWKFIFIAEAVN